MFNKIYPLLEGNRDIHYNKAVTAMRKIIKTRNSCLSEFGIQMRKKSLYLVQWNEKSVPKEFVEENSFFSGCA